MLTLNARNIVVVLHALCNFVIDKFLDTPIVLNYKMF